MASGRNSESTSEDGKSASHNSSVDQNKIDEKRDVTFSELPQSVDNVSLEPVLKRQKLLFEENSPPQLEDPTHSDEVRCLELCEKKYNDQDTEHIPQNERVADLNNKESDVAMKCDNDNRLEKPVPSTDAVMIPSVANTSTNLESLEKTSNAIAMLLKLQNFPSANSSPSHVWGRLLSLYLQHPHVSLSGYCFTIGRSRGCNLQLKDPGISGMLCRMWYSPSSVVTMENLGSNGVLQINGKVLKKNSQVVLKGGDEIFFNSGRNYSFIYQQTEDSYNTTASSLLNLTGAGVAAETFAASAHAAAAAVAAANQVAANKLSANILSIAELAAANESNDPGSKDKNPFKFPQSEPAAASASASEPKMGTKNLNERLNSISLPEDFYTSSLVNLLKSSLHSAGNQTGLNSATAFEKLKGKKVELDLDLLTLEGDHGEKNMEANVDNSLLKVENSLQKVEKMVSDDLGKLISGSVEENVMKFLAKDNGGKKDLNSLTVNNPSDNKEKDDNSTALAYKKQTIKEDFTKQIIDPKNISVNFNNFPYYLSDITKDHLFSSVFVHLKRHDFSKFAFNFSSLSPRILLTGPIGTEIYQETLVKALAHHFSSRLIIFDVTSISSSSSSSSSSTDVKEDESKVEKLPLDFPAHELVSLDDIDETIFPSTTGLLKASTARKRTFDEHNGSTNPPPPASPSTIPSTLESKKTFKKGDRVKYLGPMGNAGGLGSSMHGYFCSLHGMDNGKKHEASNIRGPYVGYKGKVVLIFEENPRKIGVCFDKPIPGGNNLGNLCPDGRGFFCNVSDLRIENSFNEDDDKIISESLFEILSENAKNSPIILFIKDVEKNLFSSLDKCSTFKRKLDKLEPKIVVIASQTVSENKKEKTNPYNLFYPKSTNGGHAAGLFDLSFLDNFPRSEERSKDNSKMNKLLSRLFPCKVSILPPQSKEELSEWKSMLERDTGIMRANSNRTLLKSILCSHNLECDNLQEIIISDSVLTSENAEKIIGWSLSHHLMSTENQEYVSEKLKIPYLSIQNGLRMFDASQKESNQTFKKALKDVLTDNEFEKRLLSEVIPPHEIGVSFNDIGALESVKETLKELVMLPLQRPELFCRGQLTKPCKGILLFGPPGTGKTMLAKAVATEAGANFINISMSTIASKWFGEGEKFVKAVFSLASKIAPSVVFIDEVDSMLGRRERPGEHEAMRKIKNEFMAHWDGLRTREQERVLVLAATNRPFDLDEAVVRRLPRRLFVNLPDCENRVKVLRVILGQEELIPDFDFHELASLTEGFSGSDLKNLCVMASFRPIRELLEKEKKNSQASERKDHALENSSPSPSLSLSSPPNLRKLCMDDFKNALGQVCASVSTDASSMQELLQWNELFGEGKLKKKTLLTYFM